MSLCTPKRLLSSTPSLIRTHSTSPYGQSHLRKTRPRQLPAPVVPHFPQHVTRADGSTFTHWTTSPRSRIILTRDTTNHPLWNATERVCGGSAEFAQDEEEEGTGRMRRWKKRFGEGVSMESWAGMQEGVQAEKEPPVGKEKLLTGKKAPGKK
ncbi:hypothetical protein V8B97DRAFT_1140246 [Scleroderma yunnanense]